jgi:hypothetical protein
LSAAVLENVTIQRRKGGDASAEKRPGMLELDVVRDLEDEVGVNHDVGRVSTVCVVTNGFLKVVSLSFWEWR